LFRNFNVIAGEIEIAICIFPTFISVVLRFTGWQQAGPVPCSRCCLFYLSAHGV